MRTGNGFPLERVTSMAFNIDSSEPLDARTLSKLIATHFDSNPEYTIRELATAAYSEADLRPWSRGFKLFWKEQRPDVKKYVVETLRTLLKDFNKGSDTVTGALILLIDTGVWKESLDNIISVGKSVSGPNFRDYKLILSSLLLDEGKIDVLEEILDNDPSVKDYASRTISFAQVPFRELLTAIAKGVSDADYRGMFSEFLTTRDERTIHKISQTFFSVFFKQDESGKGRLLELLAQLAILGNTNQIASEFFLQVIDSPPVLRMFRKHYGVEAQEFLRPMAVSEPRLTIRKWFQKVATRPYVMEYPAQQLAARGNLGILSAETLGKLAAALNRYRKLTPNFDVCVVQVDMTDTAEDVSFKIRSSTGIMDLPVDVCRIVGKLGLGLEHIQAPSTESFDGCLLRAEDLLFPLIVVNTAEKNEKRIRFTIGHEIGHYVLPNHARDIPVCSVSEWTGLQNDSYTSELEKQADAVSAALLMPREFIAIDSRGGFGSWDRIDELAGKYEVSTMALVFRMVQFIDTIPTVVFRFVNGKCDYRRFSSCFPLDWSAFPDRGNPVPLNSGAERITLGKTQSVDQVIEIGVWARSTFSTKGYTRVREFSRELGTYGIMTIVELLDPDEEELHEEYQRNQKPFGFGNMYRAR